MAEREIALGISELGKAEERAEQDQNRGTNNAGAHDVSHVPILQPRPDFEGNFASQPHASAWGHYGRKTEFGHGSVFQRG